jgi:outer membrane protein OmpA-like peptidoglycan-associated protein
MTTLNRLITMKPLARQRGSLPFTLLALAVLAGCSSTPLSNAQLEAARSDYRAAQDLPQARELAAVELRQANEALTAADAAQARREPVAEVDHLAYQAKQRSAIVQATVQQKTAEQAVNGAESARDKFRLTARTREVNNAERSAAVAQSRADASMRQAEASQRQSAASAQQANDAVARNLALEAQLKDMNAKPTDRGMVVTIGDVLFDTNQSKIKPGALHNLDKLAAFLKQYPQRTARVEGYTDSVGSDSHNQELSSQRADAVRAALVELGVARDRISTRGFGEANPVASNDNASGRQMNRRVEIVLSDEAGHIALQ